MDAAVRGRDIHSVALREGHDPRPQLAPLGGRRRAVVVGQAVAPVRDVVDVVAVARAAGADAPRSGSEYSAAP